MSGSDESLSAFAIRGAACAVARGDGSLETMNAGEGAALFGGEPFLVCHADWTARRLGRPPLPRGSQIFDILELFAFTRPAQACAPTAGGVARALGLAPPVTAEDDALTLLAAAARLLRELADPALPHAARAQAIAAGMGRAGWAWAPMVLEALGETGAAALSGLGLDMWTALPEWRDGAPPGEPGTAPLSEQEARERLSALLADAGPEAREDRPQQSDYAAALVEAFQPCEEGEASPVVLAEAGTGVGKTLAYLAPASLWAERNGPGVWVSTYTKNLQRQIEQETRRLFPEAREARRKVVIRKGRENYLCLLNYQDAVAAAATGGSDPVKLGLIARWMQATRDGDLTGGDWPAWLGGAGGLTDRRGECVYSACPHYTKCFIEKAVRGARRADLVIANHALVMTQAAADGLDGAGRAGAARRFVFDEGHHIFHAADSAFAALLSAQTTAELRTWIVGPEGGRRRGRGLWDRIGDLVGEDAEARDALDAAIGAARALPGEGWAARLALRPRRGGGIELGLAAPSGPAERFFERACVQVLFRARNDGEDYLETAIDPPQDGLMAAAKDFLAAMEELSAPLRALQAALARVLDEQASELETQERIRIDAVMRGLARRAGGQVQAWRAMLQSLFEGPQEAFVDWFAVSRARTGAFDVSMRRHWVDPSTPFAEFVLKPADGAVITSATLGDAYLDEDGVRQANWAGARARTGAAHLSAEAKEFSAASPFDYPKQSRIFIVTDVGRDDPDQVASAYRELFLAAGGGGLGVFTAIRRLRAAYGRIAPAMEAAGLPLYAQHVDGLPAASLVDIFREEKDACLLGADALRDGVDVPGEALRLVVFDRVPWARPDILHKARRERFGRIYDDEIARARLAQAYGRLIRRRDDRGVFVLLDRRSPSRLLTAFPDGVEVQRVGLAEAIAGLRDFLKPRNDLSDGTAQTTLSPQ